MVVVENERIIQVGEFIENNFAILYVFSSVCSSASIIPFILSCVGRRWFENNNQAKIVITSILVCTLTKLLLPSTSIFLDMLWLVTTLPFLVGGKPTKIVKNNILLFSYQCVVSLTRFSEIQIVSQYNMISTIVVCFDVYLYTWLVYLYNITGRGCFYELYDVLASWQIQRRFGSHESREASRSRSNRCKVSRAERRVSRQLFIRKARSYATVFGCIGATAYFTDHYIEAIILFLAYLSLRWTFPETFHAHSPRNCTIISSIVFSFICVIDVPIGVSLVSGVILALILSWQLYREWHHRNLMEDAVVKDMKIQEFEEHFNPEEQAIKKLRDAGFNELHQQITILFSIRGLTMKEVSDIVNYGEQVCKNYFCHVTKVFPEYKKGYKKH